MSKFILILFLSIFVNSAFSQGINFQGVARSANGTIIASSNVGLRLSIISKNADATPEYVETKTVVTNAQGIFSIVVGDATNTAVVGSFKNIVWSDNPKFLKVEMDPAGGTNYLNMGTTQLQYVPYSFHSYGVDGSNIKGIVPVKAGGTGVATLDELKTALKIVSTDTTFLSNRIDLKLDKSNGDKLSKEIETKLAKADTTSLSNRIDKKLDIESAGYMPNGIKPGTFAVWNGNRWVTDTLLFNNGKRISIGNKGITDSSALLDLNSNNSGLLIPRLTEVQRDNISNPAEGLMIYCLDYYGVGKGGAVQIRTTGKWVTLFSYNGNNSTVDCPAINTLDLSGVPIKDSTLTINYTVEQTTGSSVSAEPLIYWSRGRYERDINNNSYLVYDIIQGENSRTYKVKNEDKDGLKVILIPRNKPGAVCLVGDSVFKKSIVVNYNNLTLNSSLVDWQKAIDSLSIEMLLYKPVFDLMTENLKNGYSYSATTQATSQIWDYLYSKIRKTTFYIKKFPNPVNEQFKDVYGQLLTLRSILYFYALRIYSNQNSAGIPLISDNSIYNDGSLVRTNKAEVITSIIADLNLAESNLNNFSDNRRISKQFVTAFIAKVLLYKGDYASTVTQCLKYINNYNAGNNSFITSSNYYNLYNDTSSFNSSNEILFQYSLNNYGFNLTGFLTNSNSENSNYANSVGYELTAEGYNLFNVAGTDDIRKHFISRNTTSNVFFFNKYFYINDGNYGRYIQSYSKILTMAELYLIYAEALARTGNLSSSNNYLNKVAMSRDRLLSAFNINNTSDLLNQILIEKRKELFAEGEYFFDYGRIKGFNSLSYYTQYNSKTFVPSQLSTGFPIPSTVINNNPSLTQNPGF